MGSVGKCFSTTTAVEDGDGGPVSVPTLHHVLHHDYEKSRFELYENGTMAGFVQYSTGCNALTLLHTYITPGSRRGLAFILIGQVLDDMHRRRVSIKPECPLVGEFLRTHRRYLDLIASPHYASGQDADH